MKFFSPTFKQIIRLYDEHILAGYNEEVFPYSKKNFVERQCPIDLTDGQQ